VLAITAPTDPRNDGLAGQSVSNGSAEAASVAFLHGCSPVTVDRSQGRSVRPRPRSPGGLSPAARMSTDASLVLANTGCWGQNFG
jgi:hypothetical protein